MNVMIVNRRLLAVPMSADEQRRRAVRGQIAIASVVGLVAMVCGALAWRTSPEPMAMALGLLILLIAVWGVRPLIGLHLTVFLTLLADGVTVPWYPFNKNLSSKESVLFVADALTVSPLEIVLGLGLIIWLVRHFATRSGPIRFGTLWFPVTMLVVFLFVGFGRGVSSGGNLRAAVWEIRPLFCVPLVYFLVINLCPDLRRVRQLLWTGLLAVVGQSLLSWQYLTTLSATERAELESLTEHGSAIHMNLVFLMLVAAWLFKGSTLRSRIGLIFMSVPVAVIYLVSQRRAAVVALGVAFVLMAIVLLWRQPRTFRRVVPVAMVLAAGYTAAFWNTTGGLGFPAQAVKSVIQPGSVSAEDQSSDLYRIVENFDLNYTIRQSPLLGLGFGQPFYRPVALPDISFFEFWQFMPHNSFLWIWVKMGFGGFVTILFIYARSLTAAAMRLRSAVDVADVTAVLLCAAYVVMYAIYSYVDIGWDARSMVFLGVAIAGCTTPVRRRTAGAGTGTQVAADLHSPPPVRPVVATGGRR